MQKSSIPQPARYAVFLFVITTGAFAQPAPITVRVPVDCWSSLGACKIYSSRAGALTDDYQYLATLSQSPPCDTYYQLPFGSKVQSVTAEAYLFDATPLDPGSLVSLYLNGNPLGGQQVVTNSTSFGCNGYATSQRYDFASGTVPSGFSGYNVRGPNSVRLEVGAQQAAVEIVDLAVTYLPPRKFDFDIDDFTSKSDRSILISKQRTDDAYTSQLQTRDREVPIVVRANGPTGTVPNQTFYFRVLDPQSDPADAPYATDRGPDDNDDSGGGTLSGTNVTPILNAVRTVSAVSGPDGYVRMTLTITNYAAGDNYQIEGGTDQNFTCPNGCDKSGVITAWKRVYVESDRMFRAGTFLTQPFSPCTTSPCPATSVLHVENPRAIGNARRLRLIHAPRLDLTGPSTFYSEDVDVVRVNRRDGTIEVSPITQQYFGPERNPIISGQIEPFLADAVGVINGNDTADFFSANIANVGDLLTASFVQTIWLSDDPVPFIPFKETVLGGGVDSDEIALTARKWFHHANTSNHEHLLAGREGSDAETLGITRARLAASWSWIWVGSVIDHAPRRNNGEWLLNGEVTAHEIARLWQVNPPLDVTGGHCGSSRAPTAPRAWNNAQFFCTMHTPYDGPDCGGGGRATCPEFFNGVVAFHYNGINSEYTDIRRRPDPLPHN
jgi:hypothetical protein